MKTATIVGILVGLVTGVVVAFSIASGTSGGNSLQFGFAIILLGPVGLLIGGILGWVVAARLYRYFRENLSNARTRSKGMFFPSILSSVMVLNYGLIQVGNRPFTPPSDQQMLAHFKQHEAVFDKLVAMVQTDKGLTRIDDNWYAPEAGQQGGIVLSRVGQYRDLLRSVDTPRGLAADEDHRSISLLYFITGSAISGGQVKEYVYTRVRPEPLLQTLDGFTRGGESKGGYRHIKDNWYLRYTSSSH